MWKKVVAIKNHVSKVPSLVMTGAPEWQKPDTWVVSAMQLAFQFIPKKLFLFTL